MCFKYDTDAVGFYFCLVIQYLLHNLLKLRLTKPRLTGRKCGYRLVLAQ